MIQHEDWSEVIDARTRLFELPLKEVWRYRDLLFLLVRRDFVAAYKQTILGPLWFLLQPLLTTLVFAAVFGRIARIPTDGVPMVLFYMSGILFWTYFAECLNRIATVFLDNQAIFGKVYFPRLVVPLAMVISNLVKLGLQFLLFLAFFGYYLANGLPLRPNAAILLVPLLLIIVIGFALGLGMLVSAMTTKYRDLTYLLSFGIQLLMYATPVIYPLSAIGDEHRWLVAANPMSSVIETFRHALFGTGGIHWLALGYSFAAMLAVLACGALAFNRVEKTFMDTV